MAERGPRSSAARRTSARAIPAGEAKQKVISLIAEGLKVAAAMAAVGRKPDTYKSWMADDPAFKAEIGKVRALKPEVGAERAAVPDFPEFCEELGQPLHPHQLNLWDAIEGREPRWMHPSFRYQQGLDWEPGENGSHTTRVICNIPPGFAKTTSISINYATWRIYKDPNIRIVVICKDQSLAKQILGAIKMRLTSPVYRDLWSKYAPLREDGTIGFKDADQSWTQTEIFVQGKDDGEKDPTVNALGIGGRIYGARSDLIILDDSITLANVNEHEKQKIWLDQEVESRLDGRGMLLLLGTRVSPVDLYGEMRAVTDWDEQSVYSYFSMPALLEEGDNPPESWVSLWPERFPPKRLRRMRRDEGRWALVYQQQDVAPDATFNAKAVAASENKRRFPGPMTPEGLGHRPNGMADLYRIISMDPASSGCTAIIVGGVDRATGKRWVMDGLNRANMSVGAIKDALKQFVERYEPHELIAEVNGVQKWMVQDRELVEFLRSKGCRLTPHQTYGNKHDPDFGVMAMSPLFDTCGVQRDGDLGGRWKATLDTALIELPAKVQNAWVGELMNQLVVWQPSGMKQLQKTDLVMALWFFNLAAQKILARSKKVPTHVNNPFLSKARQRDRRVINIAALREAQLHQEQVG